MSVYRELMIFSQANRNEETINHLGDPRTVLFLANPTDILVCHCQSAQSDASQSQGMGSIPICTTTTGAKGQPVRENSEHSKICYFGFYSFKLFLFLFASSLDSSFHSVEHLA